MGRDATSESSLVHDLAFGPERLAVFFTCGWIGANSSVEGRTHDSRMLAEVMAVVMAPASLVLTFAGIAIPLLQGGPRTSRTVRKTRQR
jgi:hypothetical protein